MLTRQALLSDQAAVQALFEEIFPDGGCGFNRLFFKKVWRPENTLLALDGERIASMLQHWPVDTAAGRCTYIYGVATRPAYRGQGLAAGLLALAPLPHILICQGPEVFGFYEKLGYDRTFFVRRFPAGAPRPGGGRIRPMTPGDIPRVLEIYRESRPFLPRSAAHLALCLEFYGGQVLEEGGRVTAYCFDGLEAMGHRPERFGAAFMAPPEPGAPRDASPFGCSKGLDAPAPLYINLLFN